MGVNLVKGQKVNLSKDNNGLSGILIGLGWDESGSKSTGGLGGLFGSKKQSIDCDASVIMLDNNGKLASKKDLIYFGNLRSENSSVMHQGDNLTGEGEGDDEQILVDLKKVPSNISRLVFVVNIYNCVKKNQDFGMIKNAFIRVVNMTGNIELLKYNLSDNYSGKTALITGEIYRHESEWKFKAIGEGTNDKTLSEIVSRY